MSYETTTIESVVSRINRGLFLPAIQRPYVWEPDQIIALFDSLMKGYPISSFLFWALDRENRDNWEIYQFIERFRHGNVHNAKARPDGQDVTLVLDGQQRLTSLMIGLRGTYTVKAKHKRKDNPDAWSEQQLYLDLMKSPDEADESRAKSINVTYGFSFSDHVPRNSADSYWFKVGKILDYPNQPTLDSLIDEIDVKLPQVASRAERRMVERNLRRLHQIIWMDKAIAIYTERDQAYDRVLDIFIRANDGGTKLSKSDLLMSLVTLSWRMTNGRDEIFALVERLNTQLDRKNNIDRDFVLKAALVVCDLDVTYLANNFTKTNLAIIEEQWPAIKRSLEATLRLVNSFGLDTETLFSLNPLMPVIYHAHKIGKMPDGTTAEETRNRAAIHRFLLGALINGTFSGTSDSAISIARGTVRDALRESSLFPEKQLGEALERKGRLAAVSKENLDQVFEITYGKRDTFLGLSLLYDRNDWGGGRFHIDHIIPQAEANRKALMRRNLPESRIAKILEASNRLGNLQILLARENLEKNALPFKEWVSTRDGSFLEQHLIPADPDLWTADMLPEFVAARERLIEKKILSGHFQIN